ncbi:LOW QUALITY PROTEIN: hypothetical protein U9M48_041788 [Paspalum notatum var. saurae]|uniref:BED-type domain-containing protein n=1 Tax=Paspalum notatum var. saurae TaxID=547442 RepID=A0AAQ3UTX9_PASNO
MPDPFPPPTPPLPHSAPWAGRLCSFPAPWAGRRSTTRRCSHPAPWAGRRSTTRRCSHPAPWAGRRISGGVEPYPLLHPPVRGQDSCQARRTKMVSSNESQSSGQPDTSEEEVESSDLNGQVPVKKVWKPRKPRTTTKWPIDKMTKLKLMDAQRARKAKGRIRRLAGLNARHQIPITVEQIVRPSEDVVIQLDEGEEKLAEDAEEAGTDKNARKPMAPSSEMWDHFTGVVKQGKCKYCSRVIRADTYVNGTNAMRRHFNICKRNFHKNNKDSTQATLKVAQGEGGSTSRKMHALPLKGGPRAS